MVACDLFGGSGRQNPGFLLHFCLLRWSRGALLKATVDKIQAFCSIFVYFDGRARPFRGAAVNKIKVFLTVFVYFGVARDLFEGSGRQNRAEQLRPPAAQEQIPQPRALHFIKKATCRNGMSQAT